MLIRRFHAIEKQLASPALTDPDERKKLEREREQLGDFRPWFTPAKSQTSTLPTVQKIKERDWVQ
jgi:hypothetical protein